MTCGMTITYPPPALVTISAAVSEEGENETISLLGEPNERANFSPFKDLQMVMRQIFRWGESEQIK